jgi:polyisoprenoid-binding protein YceI
MKKAIFVFAFVLMAVFVMSESTTNAVELEFAERFIVDGKTAAKGESGAYGFDKAHSFIGFKVKHMGLIEVPGFFRDFTGTANYNDADVTKSSVEFSAKVTSVDTGVAGRDGHLRRDDFFDVEKFPDMTFKSTSVKKKGKNLIVNGDLTLRGVTKPVSIPFAITGFLPGERGTRMGITGETTINRRDFGVNYGGNLPGTTIPQIADQVKVVLQIEALKPKAAAAPKAAGSVE